MRAYLRLLFPSSRSEIFNHSPNSIGIANAYSIASDSALIRKANVVLTAPPRRDGSHRCGTQSNTVTYRAQLPNVPSYQNVGGCA